MGRININRPIVFVAGVLVLFLTVHQEGLAQEPDAAPRNRQKQEVTKEEHSPTKAALLSAVTPGLGQVYNRKYWKIPILYAGGAFVYYLYDYYNDRFNEYSNAYNSFINNKITEYNGITTEEGLKQAKDFYRRYRDLNTIILVGVYLVNIVDATVDAYLFNFDVSKDLSLRPATLNGINNRRVPGVSLTIRF